MPSSKMRHRKTTTTSYKNCKRTAVATKTNTAAFIDMLARLKAVTTCVK